jgi:hypothetical protein
MPRLDADLEARAVPTAVWLLRVLIPIKNDALFFQDACTFARPLPTVILYALLNYVFYLIKQLSLPLYSLVSAVVCFCVIPLDYYLFAIHTFGYWFRRPTNFVPLNGVDHSLPVDALSARLAVVYCCIWRLARAVANSLASFSFVDVGIITVILSALFYVTYLLGDLVVTWLIIQLLFFLPLIITRKFGFRILQYPDELEEAVLASLRGTADPGEPPPPEPVAAAPDAT